VKNQKGFVPVIIIILAMVGFVGVYYFGTFKTKNVVVNSTATPNVSVFSTPSVTSKPLITSQIAKWKTYSNKVFTFKYPVEWDTIEIGDNASSNSTIIVAPKEQVEKVKQIQGGFGGGKFLTLTINTGSEPPLWKTDDYWVVKNESITVGNKNGIKYNINVIKSLPGLEMGDKMTSVVIESNKVYYQIDLLDYTYLTEFDQILSTFKFTN
jgi:hypothetical protein